MRARRNFAFAAAVLTLAGFAACSSGPKPDGPATAYLSAWAKGDFAGAAKLTDSPAAAQAALQQAAQKLGGGTVKASKGKVKVTDATATVAFGARWGVPGLATSWSYDGRLAMVKKKDAWLVHWEPQDIHPKLGTGQSLSLHRSLPPRAAILDAAGQPLFIQTDVVTVGIEPRRVTDLTTLAATLAGALGIEAAPIVADVRKAKPTDFVTVITLRKADYDKVRPLIYDLPGTVFRSGQQVLAPSARFAQPLLGKVGDATAEVLAEVGPAYRSGDQLGLSGLQRALNDQLTGTATGQINVVNATGATVAKIADIAGSAGRPVKITLDRATQVAAESALAAVTLPAAIVALRPSSGEILAVANSAKAPFDIALAGQYPAGSTFKIITATAALASGVVQPTSTVACPGTVTIGGRTIPNEDKFALGDVPLRRSFARSCNTTFASLGVRTDPKVFQTTAAQYGVGAGWQFPVMSFSGSVSPPVDSVQRAFDAIGQGKVLMSPLAGELMAATVAHGTVPTPSLIAGKPATAKQPPPAGPPANLLPSLRDFTRAVVTEGTATLLAGVPGGPVAGKTGTAEFGSSAQPQAHSWFVGYQGDVAFAVFVYGGQTSGVLANPIARNFVTRLPR
ncbi:MAG: penicillin-binding transpeptidase domain-containing protein [Mycobacteriales bacterium]